METWGGGSEAESLFAELLGREGAQVESALERACAARPELAGELRRVLSDYLASERLRSRLGLAPLSGADSLDACDASGQEQASRCAPAGSQPERLELGKLLGRGGMGEVLEAYDPRLERTLALKRIRGDRLPSGKDDPERARMLARFQAEARITAQLDHPGIVPVHAYGESEGGEPYYTMTRIEGADLGAVFAEARAGRGGWSLGRAVELVARVAETVAYAHEKGVVHRDLKPSNVRVGRLGQVYVTDWGLARAAGAKAVRAGVEAIGSGVLESGSPWATGAGRVPGTPEYMAPEQAAGRTREVGPASDVYALGALLYELLAGRPPHVRGESPRSELLRRVAEESPDPLARLAPSAPSELVSIAERAMAREVGARYASAAEVSRELRAWLEGRVVRAHASGAWAELSKWIGRNRVTATALAGVVVALAIGGGAFAWKAREATTARDDLAQRIVERDRAHGELEHAHATLLATHAELERARQHAEDSAREARRSADRALASRSRSEHVVDFVREALTGKGRAQSRSPDRRIVDAMDSALAAIERGDLHAAPEVATTLKEIIAEVFQWNGRPEDALRLFEGVVEDRRGGTSDDAEALARALGHLGNSLLVAGRNHEALQRHEEEREWLVRVRGRDHVTVARSLESSATMAMLLGRKTEALNAVLEALEIRRRLADPGDAEFAETLLFAAQVQRDLGRVAEAEALLEEALTWLRSRGAGDLDDQVESLSKAGDLLRELGRTREAVQAFAAVLALVRSVHPVDGRSEAAALRNLASSLQADGQLAQARARIEEALHVTRRTPTARRSELADLLGEVGGILLECEDPSAARSHFEEAFSILQGEFPGGHFKLALVWGQLAECARALGEDREELEALQNMERLLAQLPGSVPLLEIQCLSSLAECLSDQGRSAEAVEKHRAALAVVPRAFPEQGLGRPEEYFLIVPAMHLMLAVELLGLGRELEARQQLEQIEALLAEPPGPGEPVLRDLRDAIEALRAALSGD